MILNDIMITRQFATLYNHFHQYHQKRLSSSRAVDLYKNVHIVGSRLHGHWLSSIPWGSVKQKAAPSKTLRH